MKVQIENTFLTFGMGKNDQNWLLHEFNIIVGKILSACNEDELRESFEKSEFENFIFGFGGSHFWCKQKGNFKLQNILFVEF